MNNLVEYKNGSFELNEDFRKKYADFLKLELEMKNQLDLIKEKIKEQMEKNDIRESIENEYIKITYRKPSKRTIIDSKKLKEELPDVYEEYSKTSDVSSSISIEVKC